MPNDSEPDQRVSRKAQITLDWIWLQRFIFFVALVQGSALLAVVMPREWMDVASGFLRVDPLGDSPLAGYLARLASALYALHGSTLGIVAWYLPQSLCMVKPIGIATIVFGLLMYWIDLGEEMPVYWTVLEGTALVLGGGSFVVIAGRIKT